jgi:hypothetical protein
MAAVKSYFTRRRTGNQSIRRLETQTVWLSQARMAEVFDKNVRTILEQIRNIFKENELDNTSVIRNFRITIEESGLPPQRIDGGTKENDVTFEST